jgi:hypothetical protein
MNWSMKYAEDFSLIVDVSTSAGRRYLIYEPTDKDMLGSGGTVYFGLGIDIKDGRWNTFVRDLQSDLSRAQSKTKIQKVNSFMVLGSGRIDDMKLFNSTILDQTGVKVRK